jgi:hypothetical protein
MTDAALDDHFAAEKTKALTARSDKFSIGGEESPRVARERAREKNPQRPGDLEGLERMSRARR